MYACVCVCVFNMKFRTCVYKRVVSFAYAHNVYNNMGHMLLDANKCVWCMEYGGLMLSCLTCGRENGKWKGEKRREEKRKEAAKVI